MYKMGISGDCNSRTQTYILNSVILSCSSVREKGRYRYAGQWKHGRMHGCGLYEVNERTIYVSACKPSFSCLRSEIYLSNMKL